MCPIGCLMLGSTLQHLPSDSPAPCRSACRRRRASLYTRIPTDERSSRAPGPVLVGHAVELATAQPPPTTTARSTPKPPLAQHRLRQLQAPGADSGRPRAGHGRSGRPRRPGHPSHTAACPRRAPRPHSGRTQRTRQPTDTGRPPRTPDSGHRTSGRSDGTGHWTPVAGTGKRGHWTPDAGRGRGQGDEGTAGIRTSWATTPSDRALGRPTVFLWTAPAAVDSPCRLGGEVTFPARDSSRTTSQLLGRSGGQGAPWRTAVLGRFRVERRASGEASSVMAMPYGR